MKILQFLKKAVVVSFIVGGVAGLVAAVAAEKVDELTSSDEFCSSCHTMKAYITDSETFKKSTHRTSPSGVHPSCGDCHIPKGLIAATWTHVYSGIKDTWAQTTMNYEDPKVWQAERARLANEARLWFRANDSVTCRNCHVEAAIKPERKRGQRQHKQAKEKGMTCIDCHYNLVHDEIEARDSFLDSAGKK